MGKPFQTNLSATAPKNSIVPSKPRGRGRTKKPALALPKSEVELIGRLQSWLGEDCVVSFLCRLNRVRKIEEGVFEVPSASSEKIYTVNVNKRVCPCESFWHRRRCVHLKLASVKAMLERAR